MMDFHFEQLRAFVAAVDHGTFESAARELMITPSAISQRIKALEQSVGRVLLLRTKPITTTPSGEIVLRLGRAVHLLGHDAALELHADDALTPATPAVIPIVVNADSLATWLLPVLADVAARESVVFDLAREDQDHSTDLLRAGSVMAAVTSNAEPVQGCTVRLLGRMRYRPMASPAFATRWFEDGATAQALTAAPVVVFDRKDDLQDAYLRRRGVDPAEPPRHHVPASADFATAVGLGLGWGMLPDAQSDAPLRKGELVVLDETGGVDVPLFWQQWRLHSRLLELVTAAVVDAARSTLH
ncbi:LysR family transcriptional regulator ArgP [Plantibacter sp. VKM Ac-2876]|uniref:LysR family transcriptional regulator ArgP n=1 Tax=Plantibacter sp. VKM Ac-2876 TaxID=2783826 RepID=UPI00188CD95E|nr:LysR family transcriptional regulator ArgP [Plantibacter sp. VKM Ac-2876]MBF4565043.1 LysR family transcriptional regulator ArgP [Plantibacter sp. VKM Ac-2876]